MGLNQDKQAVTRWGFRNKMGISGNIQLFLWSTLSLKADTEGALAPESVSYSSNSQREPRTHRFIAYAGLQKM